MTYIVVLAILIILIVAAFIYFKNDILSPTIVSSAMYAFSTLLALLGLLSWNDEKTLPMKIIIILSSAMVAFFIGEILARKLYKKVENNNKKEKKKPNTVKVNKFVYIGTILFIIITMICLVLEIKRICNYYNFNSNSIPKLLAFYRTKIGLFSTALARDNVDIHFIIKQMKKTCDVLCVIWMYIFFNNTSEKKLKKNILNLIPIVLCLLCTLLTSGRSLMMHMIVSFLMMYLITRVTNYKKKEIIKLVKIIGICGAGALLAFYFILPMTGRKTNANAFDYLTFYLGTPIPSFSKTIDKIEPFKNKFGEDTFSGVYYTLNKLNIIDYQKPASHEWTNFSTFNSNVYTSIRSYYKDFGIVGVIICQLVFGFAISLLYLRIKDKKEPFPIIIYSYYAYVLIDQIRDEQFYSLLSSATVAYILIMIVLYVFFIKQDELFGFIKQNLKKIGVQYERNNKKSKRVQE